PRTVGDRVALPGGDHRIRRVPVDLPTSTRREHGGVGDDLDCASGNARSHAAALVAVDNEIEDTRLLEHRDAFTLLDTRAQRPCDLGTCLIAVRVHDAMP